VTAAVLHMRAVGGLTQMCALSQLYTCSLDGTLRLWRVQTGELRDTYRIGHPVVSLVRSRQLYGIRRLRTSPYVCLSAPPRLAVSCTPMRCHRSLQCQGS